MKGVFGGEEEGGGVRSGPGEARTILLLHIISVRPSKQPLMVRTFLKVYMELGSSFLFLQEQIKDIIIRWPYRNRLLHSPAETGTEIHHSSKPGAQGRSGAGLEAPDHPQVRQGGLSLAPMARMARCYRQGTRLSHPEGRVRGPKNSARRQGHPHQTRSPHQAQIRWHC